jgi:chaperonin GroES
MLFYSLSFSLFCGGTIYMSANNCGLNPFGDQVIIEPEIEKETAGGIIMPATSEGKPVRGTVVAVGPGKKDEPVVVKTGSVVMFRKYAGTEFEHQGKNYLVLRQDDLIGEIVQ